MNFCTKWPMVDLLKQTNKQISRLEKKRLNRDKRHFYEKLSSKKKWSICQRKIIRSIKKQIWTLHNWRWWLLLMEWWCFFAGSEKLKQFECPLFGWSSWTFICSTKGIKMHPCLYTQTHTIPGSLRDWERKIATTIGGWKKLCTYTL